MIKVGHDVTCCFFVYEPHVVKIIKFLLIVENHQLWIIWTNFSFLFKLAIIGNYDWKS